jgi:hypothetical protein
VRLSTPSALQGNLPNVPAAFHRTALLAMLLGAGCAPSSLSRPLAARATPASPSARSAPPPPARSEADAGTCAYDPAADEALLTEAAREYATAGDRARLYAAVTQRPPRAFTPLDARKGPFPGRYARVVGYALRFSDDERDAQAKGCGVHALANDGTLCPSVLRSGVELTSEQAERLAAALANPDPALEHAYLRCGDFDPHHAFVFYDGAGTPIAEALVCFLCGEVEVRPSIPRRGSVASSAELGLARALCLELGLPGCRIGDDGPDAVTAAVARRRAAGLSPQPWIPAPLVDDHQRLAALSSGDKRRLCEAFERNRRGASRLPSPGGGFECVSGGVFEVLGTEACVATIPPCEVTVASVDACWRRRASDPCQVGAATRAACAPVGGCLWGIQQRR